MMFRRQRRVQFRKGLSPALMGLGMLVVVFVGSRDCAAQFDLLKSLFGPRRAAPVVFRGQEPLTAAQTAAARGEIAQSITLVREALQTVVEPLPPGDPTTQSVSLQLIELSRVWKDQQAPPEMVAEALLDIVLPTKSPRDVRLYPAPWQSNYQPWNSATASGQESLPRSLAAELVAWSVRAQSVDALRSRLAPALTESPTAAAYVLSVQVAVATQDAALARQHLSALQPLVSEMKDVTTLPAVLSAVAAAIRHEPTEAAGLALLETTLEQWDVLTTQPQAGIDVNSTWMRLAAARRHMRAGRFDDGQRLALAAAKRPLNDQRYGQEFGTHLQRLQVAEAASVLLEGHRVADALNLLGPLADEPTPRYSMYYPGPNLAAMLGRELQRLSAAERFALLQPWVMPQGDRSTIRDLTDFVPGDRSPSLTDDVLPAFGLLGNLYSTSGDLARTAAELGRLDELRQQAASVASPTTQSQAFRTYCELLRPSPGDALEHVIALAAATKAAIPKWDDQPKAPFPMLTLAVALEAARHPQFDTLTPDLLASLIDHSQRLQWDRPRGPVRLAWAEVLRRQSHRDQTTAFDWQSAWHGLLPKGWAAAGIETAPQHAGGSLPDIWLTHDDYLQHLAGPNNSHLYFQTPLTGTFTLDLDIREGGWAEGDTGYGGVVFMINGYSDQASLRGPGGTGYLNSPPLTNLLNKNPWNHQRIEVADGLVRYFANGQFLYEDRPGMSSPWFCLGGDRGRTPIFRNLRLTGTPEIPREVPLLTDARLRGWVSEYYGESRRDPLRELPQPTVVEGNAVAEEDKQVVYLADGQVVQVAAPPTDWQFRQGELQSPSRNTFWPGPLDSWMFYHRPLNPRETVQYEFYYRPGETDAHPTIGRRVFVLGADGVTAKWLNDGEHDPRGPALATDPHYPASLPLKADAWNTVELTIQTDHVTLRLNGEQTLILPLSAEDGRTFGVYHDASRTMARVRKAVLRGDWPQEFDAVLRSTIEQPQPVHSAGDRTFATTIMSEPFFTDNAYQVYRRALALEGVERYNYLYHWVMPGPTHATLRTVGALTPTHPAPPALADNPIDIATAEARQAVDDRRVQAGGNFVCPAILLILSAAELNRLEELSQAIDALDSTRSAELARGQTALLGLIALLQDRPEEALAAVWELIRLVPNGPAGEGHTRWSEPALCSLAILHPVTREAAYELLDRIQRRHLQGGQPGPSEFGRFVRQLHGQVHYLKAGGDPATFGAQPQLTQWRAVSQACARTNGPGYPIGVFDSITGELALRGGHDFDMAYFQSPLRGNYEVRVRLTQYDYRELMPYVAGICNVLQYTHEKVKVQAIHSAVQEQLLSETVTPNVRSWGDYRIVVRDGHYTCYIGDQPIYESAIAPGEDPWLAIVGWAGGSQRHARNVVISGSPEIPDELELLNAPDLRAWLSDYYGAAAGQSPYPWRLEAGILQCDQVVLRNAIPGRLKIENLIRYHRPMLEDGEITYEFYYDPVRKVVEPRDPDRNYAPFNTQPPRMLDGQTHVHPVLDRMVCLLEPDGVKIHWLTDGKYDRTGLLAGNVIHEPDRGPDKLPLRPQDWNSVKLAIAGDMLTIVLNGELVFTRPLEPTNLRQFGLFHFVNESAAQVRNVRYRGDWPKTLPSEGHQELAVGPERFADLPPADVPARYEYDFTSSHFEPAKFGYQWNSQAAGYLHPTTEGLRVTLPAGQAKPQVAGVKPKVQLSGDFVATLDYTDLKTEPVEKDWGSGLSFKVVLDGSYETGFEIRKHKPLTVGTSVMWQLVSPHKQYLYYSESNSDFPAAGRLRIVRRGETMYFLMAEPGSEDFRLVTHRPFGTSNIKQLNLQADCSDQAGMADVVFQRLTIQAAKITTTK